MFSKVDYVMINVRDMDRSVAFYRDVLGLPLAFQSPEWSEFSTGATKLALHGGAAPAAPSAGPPPAGTASIGFAVDDLDAAAATLEERGARFVMPPTDREGEGIRLAVLVDPDGHPVSLSQSTR